MKRTVHLAFLFVILCLQAQLNANTRFCTQHGRDINRAQDCAVESMYQAHRAGGRLFRDSYVSTVYEIARKQVLCKNTYTDLSNVMRESIARCDPPGVDILYDGWHQIAGIFSEIYNDCTANHGHPGAYYERGRISYDSGNYEGCVADLTTFIEKGGSVKAFSPDMKRIQGEALNGVLEYERAIEVLSEIIKKDPNDKEAYFQRAVAYFETGNYDDAWDDYERSGVGDQLAKIKLETSQEFADAFLSSLASAAKESAYEIIPSLWYTMRGIGSALWTRAQDPGAALNDFINSSHEAVVKTVKFMQSVDEKFVDDCINECQRLVAEFEALSDAEKGDLLGYLLGKYGVEVLAAEFGIEGVTCLKKLRKANERALFDTAAVSKANKENIIAESAEHLAARERNMKGLKIEKDKQNKHIVGSHNYEPHLNRSIFTHNNPQALLEKFASTGTPRRDGIPFGAPGYREVVNFREVIGYYVEKKTGIQTATTFGEIHYSKNGAHIVPVLFR